MEAMEQDKKRLFVVGAGGFGRELELWINKTPEVNRDFTVIGYIDDNPNALEGYPSLYKIMGSIDTYNFRNSDYAVISISEPIIKQNVYNRLKNRVNMYTFIANTAIVGDHNNLGEGSVICPNSIISANVRIGTCVTVNCGTQIGHDSIVGEFSSFMANVMIGGESKIAERVYFGSQSALVPRKKVCKDAKISAGSIVIGNINKKGVYFGNPAKLLFS
jgi:sugar O-acyltransferase (sialic acid O-acetyltransferase NeuD family)